MCVLRELGEVCPAGVVDWNLLGRDKMEEERKEGTGEKEREGERKGEGRRDQASQGLRDNDPRAPK